METTIPASPSIQFNDTHECVDFFQQRLQYLLTYWRDHEAVKKLQIAILDRERAVILKVISLGLDIKPLWCIARPLIIALTPYMERRGHWEEWHQILERAIGVAQRQEDVAAETNLTALLARLCQRMSRPEEVVKNYRRVIRLAKKSGNRFEKARACSNLGYLYIDGGKWWRSEVLSLHALVLFEELESDHGRAHTHNHLGVLYTRQSILDRAEEHLLNALKIWASMDDQHGLMRVHGNLGLLYRESDSIRQSIEHSRIALEQAQQTGEESLSGMFLINIAVAEKKRGYVDEAYSVAKDAESIFLEYPDMLQLAYVWHQLCLLNFEAGRLSEASYYKAQALGAYDQLNRFTNKAQLLTEITNIQSR